MSKYCIFLKNSQNIACQTTIWFHFKEEELAAAQKKEKAKKEAKKKENPIFACSVTITHGFAYFGPGGLKGYAVQRHFWHFFRFVNQIRAKAWVIVTLHPGAMPTCDTFALLG